MSRLSVRVTVAVLVLAWAAPPVVQAAVTGLTSVTSLAAGGDQTCAILSGSGGMACWGESAEGELGNGLLAVQRQPVQVSGLEDAISVSVGEDHQCALRPDGTVACWGYDGDGELGDGSTRGSAVPVAVHDLSDVLAVSAGEGHSCAVLSGGRVACWGYNHSGQLGDGTTRNRAVPVAVRSLSDATAVSAGGSQHSCAVRANRMVVCWGYGRFGELGNGTRRTSSTPVGVHGLADAIAVSAGPDHTCALHAAGGVACWGYNGFGQLGDGTTADRTIPVAVRGLTDATSIAAGEGQSCAVRAGGSVVCWGYNGHGELGRMRGTSSPVPIPVAGVAHAVAVTAGFDHTCALLAGAGATCWGSNAWGQLGDGSPAAAAAPPGRRARIAFYPLLPLAITGRTTPEVRPATALLFADGQWALEDLTWSGWGSRVARANGVSSSSNDIPAAGPGRRILTPARLIVSRPGRIDGHRVYRCYRLVVTPSAASQRGCLKRLGRMWYYLDPRFR